MADQSSGDHTRRQSLLRAAVELCVVVGSSLAFVWWIAPRFIAPGSNLGLPPATLPTICASAIGLLAVVQFGFAIARPDGQQPAAGHLPRVAGLVGAAIVATLILGNAGLVAGGAAMTGIASVLLGERRIAVIAAMALGGACITYGVEWSGL